MTAVADLATARASLATAAVGLGDGGLGGGDGDGDGGGGETDDGGEVRVRSEEDEEELAYHDELRDEGRQELLRWRLLQLLLR